MSRQNSHKIIKVTQSYPDNHKRSFCEVSG